MPPESTYRIDDLPPISRPRERVAALNARIKEEGGKRLFALCSTLALPVEVIWVGAQGCVWMEEFEGAWRLTGHLQWLTRQPLPTGIPGQDAPLARYQALQRRMYGTVAVPLFDMTGQGDEFVPAASVFIHADGRVSREHFRCARPLQDHITWLEQKRSVAEFLRKMREELDARARRELREMADMAPRELGLRTRAA